MVLVLGEKADEKSVWNKFRIDLPVLSGVKLLLLAPREEVIEQIVEEFEIHEVHWAEALPEELVCIRKFDALFPDIIIMKLEVLFHAV